MKKDIDLEVSLVEVGIKVDIDNLFFFGGFFDLLFKLLLVFFKFKIFMEVNLYLIIEIVGYVNVLNELFILEQIIFWKLFVDCVKVVYDYLFENGIFVE